ncbi:ribonuclease II, partial [Streptomyces sp. BF-3]
MTGAADCSLGAALRALRTELDLPGAFPPEVLAEAEQAARAPDLPAHLDATDIPFLTIDPPASTDLDQAMHLERRRDGRGYRVLYAIADVAAYLRPGGAPGASPGRG